MKHVGATRQTARSLRRLVAFLITLTVAVLGARAALHAQPSAERVGADIRTRSALASAATSVGYALRVADCSDLVAVVVDAGGEARTTAVSEMTSTSASPACELFFEAVGPNRLNPSATLKFSDGGTQTLTEAFAYEHNPPALAFGAVSFSTVSGKQHLNVSVSASDDVNLSGVALSVLGLRASDLRAVGGIVDQARPLAFAEGEVLRVPDSENQTEFSLSIPALRELSGAEIASDGIVIVEAEAFDASGNRSTFSRLALTGSDVTEEALSLSLHSPVRDIVFTTLLETAAIVPMVHFEFRGPTELPGLGTGVTYTSSHPDLVAVTPGGVVYPLAETNGQSVTITVSYPGVPSVAVGVEVDPTKTLTELRFDGVLDGNFQLTRLNEWQPLPPVIAVFDDGTETDVGAQFGLSYVLDPDAASVLRFREDRGLLAVAPIAASHPLTLHVGLELQPSVTGALSIAAVDALPTGKIDAPASVSADSEVTFQVRPSDDVGVTQVEFFVDGIAVGRSVKSPYAASFVAPRERLNATVVLGAVVTDSAGQRSARIERPVRVVADATTKAPPVTFAFPQNLQQYVEQAPIRFQVQRDASEQGTISYVEFFVDDGLRGEARVPIYQYIPELQKTIEIWRLDSTVREASADVTSRSVYAVVHAGSARSETETRVYRVYANQRPAVVIDAPRDGHVLAPRVPTE